MELRRRAKTIEHNVDNTSSAQKFNNKKINTAMDVKFTSSYTSISIH